MSGLSQAALVLGSQAGSAVLVEQPQAYITQKARRKRDRRTEWDYFVQFPEFPDQGCWYSARELKTQHPHGAELIREFESADEDVSTRQEAAQQAVPLTQDAGPSQIGPIPSASQLQHFTQQQGPSQIQLPADNPAGQSAAQPLQAGFQPVHSEQYWWPHHTLHNAASDHSLAGWSSHGLRQDPPRNTNHPREALPYGEQYSMLQAQEQMRQNTAHEQDLQQAGRQPAPNAAGLTTRLPHAYLPMSLQQPAGNSHLQQQHSMPLQQGPHVQISASTGRIEQPAWRNTFIPHGHPEPSVAPHPLPHQPASTAAPHPGSQPSTSAQAHLKHASTLPANAPPTEQRPASGQSEAHPAYAQHAVLQGMTSPAPQHAQQTGAASGHTVAAASQGPQSSHPPTANEPRKAGVLQVLTNDLTSRILSEKANQWRQTNGKKGTGLLNLVPSGAQQLQQQQQHTLSNGADKVDSQAGPSTQQHLKQLRAEQNVDAFRPAVQECIDAADLRLSRPFHQQVMMQAVQQRAAATAAGTVPSAQPVSQPQLAMSPGNAQHTGNPGTNREVTTDELFLCPDQVGDVERHNAHVHIAEKWQTAFIKGARRVGDSLELHVVWSDGFDTWLSLEALKKREHCKSAIIDFLVSKVRKRSKG